MGGVSGIYLDCEPPNPKESPLRRPVRVVVTSDPNIPRDPRTIIEAIQSSSRTFNLRTLKLSFIVTSLGIRGCGTIVLPV